MEVPPWDTNDSVTLKGAPIFLVRGRVAKSSCREAMLEVLRKDIEGHGARAFTAAQMHARLEKQGTPHRLETVDKAMRRMVDDRMLSCEAGTFRPADPLSDRVSRGVSNRASDRVPR